MSIYPPVHINVCQLCTYQELPYLQGPRSTLRATARLIKLTFCYKQELVGSITIFARDDSSPCKACKVRRAAGSIVRGQITISLIINDIIVNSAASGGQGR